MKKLAARAAKILLATCLVAQAALPAAAQGANLPLIRDAEIEILMRIYT